MVDQFEDASIRQMDQLKEVIGKENWEIERDLCHSIKGMALNIGLDDLAKHFLQAELNLHSKRTHLDLEHWKFLLDKLQDTLQDARQYLSHKIAS